ARAGRVRRDADARGQHPGQDGHRSPRDLHRGPDGRGGPGLRSRRRADPRLLRRARAVGPARRARHMTDRIEVALSKRLDRFDLDVAWRAGDGVAVLFGPSGAGKTLTLHCLAGLVRPDRGRIVVNGTVFFDADAGIDVPPQRRRVGYVFQGYALFPHLTVEENVGFGLR